MSNHQEHFQAFLTYAFIPLLLIGMILVIIMLSMLGWDMLKDRFPRFPKHTAKVDTTIPRDYVRPVHKDCVEQAKKDGWEPIAQLSINPDYVIMTKPAED